jgi:hypothetical protein
MGRPLAFYDLDVEWPRPNAQEELLMAKTHVKLVEGQLKLRPDQVILQSWNPNPTHALPD